MVKLGFIIFSKSIRTMDFLQQLFIQSTGPATNSTHYYEAAIKNGKWVGTVDTTQVGSGASFAGYGIQFMEEILSSVDGNAYKAAFFGTTSQKVEFSSTLVKYNGVNTGSPSLNF